MTAYQLQMTAVIADLILPATDAAPAPSAIGVPDFVDEWVSAPYPEQQADRGIILSGLTSLDAQARRRWLRSFLDIEDVERLKIIDEVLVGDRRAESGTKTAFYRRFRYVVVGAYYTAPEGLKDIGFIGNVPLPTYPPITALERSILDAELRTMGIA